jgi:hypothetical protein
MKTAADYVSAATAVADAPTDAPAAVPNEPVAPVAPVAPVDQDAGTVPPAEMPAAPVKTKAAISLEQVAAAKAALRKEKEEFAGQSGPSKAMTEAAAKKDAMALLAAAGISWADAARQVLEGGGAGPAAKKPAAEEVDPRDARLAALEAEIQSNKSEAMRSKVMTQVQTLVKDNPKFKYVAGRAAEAEVISFIERYHEQTGELPGDNIAESLEIAAEAVETHLAKEAASWSKLLTPVSSAVTPPAKAAVPAAEATSQQAKTLTSSTGSGPKTAPVASKKSKTPEEYQQAALDALTAQ